MFIPEVAKQHHVFAGTIAFGVLVSARASFGLDKNHSLPKPALVPPCISLWRNATAADPSLNFLLITCPLQREVNFVSHDQCQQPLLRS